jgi:hypothetical protein
MADNIIVFEPQLGPQGARSRSVSYAVLRIFEEALERATAALDEIETAVTAAVQSLDRQTLELRRLDGEFADMHQALKRLQWDAER